MASQFSYIEARKAFPCFDEPAFKAVFKTKIIHDSSLNAISNMPVVSRTSLYVVYLISSQYSGLLGRQET